MKDLTAAMKKLRQERPDLTLKVINDPNLGHVVKYRSWGTWEWFMDVSELLRQYEIANVFHSS